MCYCGCGVCVVNVSFGFIQIYFVLAELLYPQLTQSGLILFGDIYTSAILLQLNMLSAFLRVAAECVF